LNENKIIFMRKPFLQPQALEKRTVLSVTQVNRKVKNLFEQYISFVWVEGEISNFTQALSGHIYFTLKDAHTQIRCVFFRFKQSSKKSIYSNGDQILLKGKMALYEAKGDVQLIVEHIESTGLGLLQQRLQALMEKLQTLSLFSIKNKKKLPPYPKKIGIITSPKGAAIQDVLSILKRRNPIIPIIIYPTSVQGKIASQSIINMLLIAEKRNECDVLLMTRGGGSLEDLWCFNDEALAFAMAQCKIPIIAAIGHEIDTSIAELVADMRAPTPSAAAEILSPDYYYLMQMIDTHYRQLMIAIEKQVKKKEQKMVYLSALLQQMHPKKQWLTKKNECKQLHKYLKQGAKTLLQIKKNRLYDLAHQLNVLSPLSTLERGYTIIKDQTNGKILNKSSDLHSKQKVSIIFHDGEINAQLDVL
jgi:exodeoxyribonuclease VII large subunit